MTATTQPAPHLAAIATIAISAILSACTTAPSATTHATALVTGEQATIEGEIVRVDTTPWTYDGNAVITIATRDAGTINVQLPARWNLCKAPAPDDVQDLKPRERVQATGTVTDVDTLVVCEQPQHGLRKLD